MEAWQARRRLQVTVVLLMAAPLAMAGRPLASDDASTTEAGSCQLEAWSGRAGSERSLVLAPACGLLPGLELAADRSRFSPRGTQPDGAGLALKWLPPGGRVETGLGELNLGLKFSGAWGQLAGSSWRATQTSVLGVATWKPGQAMALHANLGAARDRASGTRATLLNLALVWSPQDALLLFAESLANSQRAVFGGAVRSAGARWWLVQDTLGLDLTASREAGVSGPTRWTFGLGWYGIGW